MNKRDLYHFQKETAHILIKLELRKIETKIIKEIDCSNLKPSRYFLFLMHWGSIVGPSLISISLPFWIRDIF